MTKTALLILFCASLAINVGAFGAAAYRNYGFRDVANVEPVQHGGAHQLQADLGLSTDQQTAFEQARDEAAGRIDTASAQLRVRRQELFGLLTGPSPDRTAIDRALVDISAGQLTIQRAVVNQWVQQQDVLTETQRSEFVRLERWPRRTADPGGAPRCGGGRGAASRRRPRGWRGGRPRGQGAPLVVDAAASRSQTRRSRLSLIVPIVTSLHAFVTHSSRSRS